MNIKKLLFYAKPKNWKKLYKRKKELVLYIIFGAATTFISFLSYFLFRIIFPDNNKLGILTDIFNYLNVKSETAFPVILSWIISVTFAYITNRIFVFKSFTKGFVYVVKEALSFYLARIFTLILDVLIMFLFIDLTGIDNLVYEFVIKMLSNVVVLTLNYVLSKIFIFRNKKRQ